MASLVSANVVSTGQIQSLDSVRGHSLPSDALIFASGTQVNPQNQNLGSYAIVESSGGVSGSPSINVVAAVTQSPFADLYKEGSMYFPGATTSNIYASLGSSYSIGNGLTAECWVNYSSFAGSTLNAGAGATSVYNPCALGAFTGGAGSCAWALGADTNGKLLFYYYSSSAVNQSANTNASLSLNTWNHIAVSIPSSGPISLYINGVQQTSNANNNGSLSAPSASTVALNGTTASYNYLGLGAVYYGGGLSAFTTGYVADARVVYGTALYTGSSFTVPSAPLSPSATGSNALLLRAGQNSPTIQSGALTFDRGLRQFYNFGPQTLKLSIGFTAVFKITWNGTALAYERVFDFVTTTSGGAYSVGFARNSPTSQFYFYVIPATGGIQAVTTAGSMVQGTTYIVTARYSPVTGIVDIWINGTQNASASGATGYADFTCTNSLIGIDASKSSFPESASMNCLAVYNRALSNTEIYNSYLALSTTPQTPQNSTLEIGDVNGTPALRITGDGRVNIQKLGASSNVLPWPPAAMTGYVTSINGGTYVASASTEYSSYGFEAWRAYDKVWVTPTNSAWAGSTGYFTTAPYACAGTVTTTDVNGNSYLGDWNQIQLPSPVLLSSYTLYPINTSGFQTQSPSKFVILGSRDGINWTLVSSQSGISWTYGVGQTFSATATQSFNYYRLVSIQLSGVTTPQVTDIAEIIYYGTTDLQQPLSVTQPLTLNYGAQTSSLVGIPNPGVYVPQDFSSSALNIPAYVVSNTASVGNVVSYAEFGPFAGEGSLYFPGGTGAYVNFGNQLPVWPSTALMDATFEAWIYLTQQSPVNMIFNRTTTLTSGSNDWGLFINGSGVLYNVMYNNGKGASAQTSLAGVPVNAWTHVAWSFKSGVSAVFINGTASSASPAITSVNYTSSALTTIGQYNNTSGNMFNGYIASARIISGLALYQSAFTPPTAPLQPLQGTTQAGLPYGTVLLLRNAPAPGRVLTQKFAGQNSFTGPAGSTSSANSLAFPPAAMTGYSTSLSSGYGQGTYVASASAEFSGTYAWNAFDKNTGTQWGGQSGQYTGSGSAPFLYVGGSPPKTVDVNGTSYTGDWVQIQMPSSIVLSSYAIYYNTSYACPGLFYILGSRDGINWTLVDQRTQAPPSSAGYITFSVSSSQAFSYFRLQAYGVTTTGGTLNVLELIYNGSIEGPTVSADGRLGVGVSAPVQQLEVAGNMVVNGTVSSQSTTFRNVLYNGDMRINQRGINTTSSPTAMGTTSTAYALDRWLCYRTGYASGGTVAQGTTATTDLPYQNDGLTNFLRIGRSVGDTSTSPIDVWNVLESKDSYRLAGKFVTMSFYYRTGVALAGSFQAVIATSTGTDQNASAAWAGGVYQSYTLSASSSWTKVSFSAQVPISATQVGVYFQYGPTTATAVANDYFDITGVQLEKGTIATPFEVRPYATELALCQRYYCKTFPYGTAPAQAAGQTGSLIVQGAAVTTFSGTSPYQTPFAVTWQFPVEMRANPAITTYSTNNATANWYDQGGGDLTASTSNIGTRNASIYMSGGTTAVGRNAVIHAAANAEL